MIVYGHVRESPPHLVARLDEAIAESFGTDSGRLLTYWNNANTVGDDGWVYMGWVNFLALGTRWHSRCAYVR